MLQYYYYYYIEDIRELHCKKLRYKYRKNILLAM